MRILQIMAGNEEGGLEKHFVELSNRLSAKHEVHIVAHTKYQDRFDKKVKFHALDLSKGRRNPLILFRLLRVIGRVEPEVIHAHANKAADMIASIKILLRPSIKTVATLHSSKKDLRSFEKFDHVIGVSHAILERVKNPHKSVVYNGIDMPKVLYREDYLQQFGVDKGFVICAIGRLEVVKNFSLLIHALQGIDAYLLLVGEGSEEHKLKKLVKKLGMEKRVIFTGFRNDVPAIIAYSDLCVISSDREGFSYVAIESLLLKRPLVTTDVSDMAQVLPQEYVVPVGDENELRKKIVMVQTEYESALNRFAASFEFAKTYFTVDAMVKDVEDVYSKVMQG